MLNFYFIHLKFFIDISNINFFTNKKDLKILKQSTIPMVEKDYRKLVESISKKQENMTCVDCDSKYPKWVSVRYGTFMCLDCAGIHRSLGVYLDFVKSIGLDTWDKESYLPVKYGGNEKFKEYIQSQNISTSDIYEKYKKQKIIDYSKSLMEEIKNQTGQSLKSAEDNNRRTQVKTTSVDYRKVNEENEHFGNDSRTALSEPNAVYSSSSASKLKSSWSNISTTIAKHAKNITEKTMIYSGKIGHAVADHAKNFVTASTDAISNLKKTKNEEKSQAPFILKPREDKNTKDWS